MKTIGKYRVPEGWSEVTLEELIQVNDLIRSKGENFSERLVNVFNSEVKHENYDDFFSAFMAITELVGHKPDTDKKLPKYTANGIEFSIVQPEQMDVKEFVDVIALNEADNLRNVPLILAILTENCPEKPQKWAETLKKELSVETALGNLSFFFGNLIDYIKAIPYYSQIAQKMKENETKTIKKK